MNDPFSEELYKEEYEVEGDTFRCPGCKERTKIDGLYEAHDGKFYCYSCGTEKDANLET